MESILTSIKKLLGMPEEYTAFDPDIIMHINTVFMILHQLGVGPSECFKIEGEDATWLDFIGSKTDIESVKTYVYLRVRLVFDPPQNSSLIEAMRQQINELEFRLNVASDST